MKKQEKTLNILFITYCNVSPLNGAICKVVSFLAGELSKLPRYNLFSAYYKTKHASTLSFRKTLQVDNKNITSELFDFVRENKIDIILNNVPERTNHKFLFPALQYISKQCPTCKILYHFHGLPGYEKINNQPKIYWSRLVNGQCKPSYIYKMMLCFIVNLVGSKLFKSHLVRKYRGIYQSADKILLLSKAFIPAFASCANVPVDDKLIAINNALTFPDSIEKNLVCRKQKEALIVARLDEISKRLSRALKIWKKIEANPLLSEWRLTIVGDGEDKYHYQTLAKRLKLKRVFFEGFQKPEAYYKRASIFIMTSAHEGFGLTLTEAHQMGVVPIVFDSFGAVHDIIESEYNGLIIPNGDIKKYAEQLAWLMQHDEERQAMAYNAVESSKWFYPSKIFSQWVQLLNTLKNDELSELSPKITC